MTNLDPDIDPNDNLPRGLFPDSFMDSYYDVINTRHRKSKNKSGCVIWVIAAIIILVYLLN